MKFVLQILNFCNNVILFILFCYEPTQKIKNEFPLSHKDSWQVKRNQQDDFEN